MRAVIPDIVSRVQAINPASAFGAVGFIDKPFGGFGLATDYVYRLFQPVTRDADAIADAYAAMTIGNGSDPPEAQLEALFQIAKRADGEVGFRSDSLRVVVLFTDGPFHVAGDGDAAGIPRRNDGDGSIEGSPPGSAEDYPTIAQLDRRSSAAASCRSSR